MTGAEASDGDRISEAAEGVPSRDRDTRNAGTPFHEDWVRELVVNGSAVERRARAAGGSLRPTGAHRVAWLLKALTVMDLTSLSGDDTPGHVRRLCSRALRPLDRDLVHRLVGEPVTVTPAAVCVYHAFVRTAVDRLGASGIPVAAVSAGFPHGLSPLSARVKEIEESVRAGAREIDAVIPRWYALDQEWGTLHDELRAFRTACGDAHLKVILATGELGSLTRVARASLVAMMAGADFIKTSTGKESVNATLPVGLVMAREIRRYRDRTGFEVGLKAAGGIRTASKALEWLMLVHEVLGAEWLEPSRFRIGASSLLGDLERHLELHDRAGDRTLPGALDV